MLSKNKKNVFAVFTFVLGLISIYFPVLAASSSEGWQIPTDTNLPDRPVADILLSVIEWAIILIGIIGVIIFIYAGFMYLTSQGESDRIEQAKRIVLWGVVGIAVSILGLIAVRTVDDLLRGNGSSTSGSGPTSAPAPAPSPSSGGAMPTAPGM